MIHNRIALWRAERGMSRRQLAEAVGIHVQTVGFIERGAYSPSLEVGMQIAATLGARVEAVFSLKPFPPLDTQMKDAA